MTNQNKLEQLKIIKKEAEGEILNLLPDHYGCSSESLHLRASIQALAVLNGNIVINNQLILQQLEILKTKKCELENE